MAYLDGMRQAGRSNNKLRLIRLTATRLPGVDREGEGDSDVKKCVKLFGDGAAVSDIKLPEARTKLELMTAPHKESRKPAIIAESKTFADADKLEKALRPNVKEATLPGVCGEAVVVSKLKPRGGNEATEDVKSDALHPELDADADIRMMVLSSSKQKRALVPLLQSLGTVAAAVLAVIATAFLTEFLLCIALSTGPVVVVVRGIGALICSTARRVSGSVRFTKQVAVDALRFLPETLSQMKFIVKLVACVTTTTAVLAVCTHPMAATTS